MGLRLPQYYFCLSRPRQKLPPPVLNSAGRFLPSNTHHFRVPPSTVRMPRRSLPLWPPFVPLASKCHGFFEVSSIRSPAPRSFPFCVPETPLPSNTMTWPLAPPMTTPYQVPASCFRVFALSSARAFEGERPIVAKAAAVKRVRVDSFITHDPIHAHEKSSTEMKHHILFY